MIPRERRGFAAAIGDGTNSKETNTMRRFLTVSPLAGLCLVAAVAAGLAGEQPAANRAAVEAVRSGEKETAEAAWWGFDAEDSTAAVQSAIDSGAKRVILDNRGAPWIVDKIELAGDQELVLQEDVTLLARRGAFRGKGDCLLSASGKQNVRISGHGATIRMWRDDYARPPYEKSEWRHAVSIRSCTGVRISGLTIAESGGDGIYLGVSRKGATNKDVAIRDVVCTRNYRQGISVISAENLLIENTVLRDTAGTPPMAGIDFEPNDPSERLVNCVMRKCLVENNAGDGFEFYLKNLTAQSTPISIRLEKCRSIGNRTALRFATGNGEPRTAVPGKVEVSGCRFETSGQSGIVLSGKPADVCPIRFEDCQVVDVARGAPNLAPIRFQSAAGDTRSIGGVEFVDVTVVDRADRLPLGYQDLAGGLKLVDVTGTLTLERDARRTVYRLDQTLLDRWFPFQAFKEFPPFDEEGVRFRPAEPEAAASGPWSCAVRQRGHADFLVWAEAGEDVTFDAVLQPVGRVAAGRASVEVISPSGQKTRLADLIGAGEAQRSIAAKETGAYRITCDPGASTVKITESSHPICLYSPDVPFHLLGSAGDFYFRVPAGVTEFAVRLSGGGEGESLKAAVYDSGGEKLGEQDNITGHQFLLRPASSTEARTWRLRVERPGTGVLEDYYVQLQGIPPILATSDAALLGPAD